MNSKSFTPPNETLPPAFHKIAVVTVPVAYRKPGNVIEYVPVEFEVEANGTDFHAIPLCTKAGKRLTDLPDMVSFQMKDQKIITPRNRYREVAEEIGRGLQRQEPQG